MLRYNKLRKPTKLPKKLPYHLDDCDEKDKLRFCLSLFGYKVNILPPVVLSRVQFHSSSLWHFTETTVARNVTGEKQRNS